MCIKFNRERERKRERESEKERYTGSVTSYSSVCVCVFVCVCQLNSLGGEQSPTNGTVQCSACTRRQCECFSSRGTSVSVSPCVMCDGCWVMTREVAPYECSMDISWHWTDFLLPNPNLWMFEVRFPSLHY